MKTTIVILAAGDGTRMKSNIPKSLHRVAGKTMLKHIVDNASVVEPDQLVVVHSTHGSVPIKKELSDTEECFFVEQEEPQGTGHAIKTALPSIKEPNTVIVLLGDVPLVKAKTIELLQTNTADNAVTILTTIVDAPRGYGRIIRNKEGQVKAIVEESECTEEQRKIKEINTGIMAFAPKHLKQWLGQLGANNKKGEYYLTDVINIAYKEGHSVGSIGVESEMEVFGVNDKKGLAKVESAIRKEKAEELLDAGVTLADPKRIDIRGSLVCGKDVFIDVGVVFEGNVTIGDNVEVGPHSIISETSIGSGTKILSHCNIEKAAIGNDCNVGPFARLRPETELMTNAKIGNFVETKKSTIGQGSKVNHLSYIGDTIIGEDTNIGAGTITCNYDGANKHQTNIGDSVFIGSGVELVAPIEVESGATIAAGSTITKKAMKGRLVIERSKQKNIDGWQRPTKNKGK